MTTELIFGALGVGVLLYFNKRASEKSDLQKKAVEVAAGAKPVVNIANTEAIEERRVWVFQPVVNPTLTWNTGGSGKGPVIDFAAAADSLSSSPRDASIVGDSLDLIDIGATGYTALEAMPLRPGAFYDAKPIMGTHPFNDIRARWTGTKYFPRANPVQFRYTANIDADIWESWWTSKIATVAEQVEAGGVVTVPPSMK